MSFKDYNAIRVCRVVVVVLSKHECHAMPLVLKKKGIITHSYLDLSFFALN